MIYIKSFGGLPGWIIHKYFSGFFFNWWLCFTEHIRRRQTDRFVRSFVKKETAPLFNIVEIETVNRCNGTCAFCPANIKSESRPFMQMSDELFQKIVSNLADLDFDGEVLLEVNNEPLIDKRLPDFLRMIKENVPKARTAIITNGTLLTIEKFDTIYPYLDRMVINNYSERYRLKPILKKLYDHIQSNRDKYKDIKIELRRRYVAETLTNRAGSAPNKRKKGYDVSMSCLYPFVGITIFPNGNVGLCSNDCFEKTNYGNLNELRLEEVWNGESFRSARKAIARGRKHYKFCAGCDVLGIGTRELLAKNNGK